ncbi:MAG: ArsR/SmtB family transcription factor [Thermoguttaceae bacterium]
MSKVRTKNTFVKGKCISDEQCIKVLKALSNPIRLKLVKKMTEGDQCVCDCLKMFDIDFSTLSRHMIILKKAGIILDEKRGKNVYYSLNRDTVFAVFECLKVTLNQQ